MLDAQQHAYYLTCAAQSWLAVRLELIGTLVITFACFVAIVQHAMNGANEKFAGLLLNCLSLCSFSRTLPMLTFYAGSSPLHDVV